MLEALSRGHQAWPWGAYVDFDLWLAITLRPIPAYVISIARYDAFGTAGSSSKNQPILKGTMCQRSLKGE
ncbi:hypothetical protein FPT15_00795 [Pseudomonas sp. RGB]|nr:hypothetical protein FPT15_00795 [Pseudomonas sp. RGB]